MPNIIFGLKSLYYLSSLEIMTGGPLPVTKKYTVQSKGIWEKIRVWLTLVPNRSTGNPYVPWYREPNPGSRPEAASYQDPATLPSSDIAGNPYWKRDHRRNYPKIAAYNQSTIAGLLLYGSAATPRIADGEAGTKALTAVNSGEVSLTQTLSSVPKTVVTGEVLEASGLPPVPPSLKAHYLKIRPFSESGMYSDDSSVRSFV